MSRTLATDLGPLRRLRSSLAALSIFLSLTWEWETPITSTLSNRLSCLSLTNLPPISSSVSSDCSLMMCQLADWVRGYSLGRLRRSRWRRIGQNESLSCGLRAHDPHAERAVGWKTRSRSRGERDPIRLSSFAWTGRLTLHINLRRVATTSTRSSSRPTLVSKFSSGTNLPISPLSVPRPLARPTPCTM